MYIIPKNIVISILGYVYSYNTKVAEIMHETKEVLPLGWWSKTTTKHINYVAKDLGYKVLHKI